MPVKDIKTQAEQTYKKDMLVKVDDNEYRGVGVLPLKDKYKITLSPKDKASRILIMNCHREIVVDKPKTGWFSNAYTFIFEPLDQVEKGKLCQLEIASLNVETKNSFAFFEFDDSRPEISLQGFVRCNGEYKASRAGVSLCQSAEGLEQQIFFQEKVLIEGVLDNCNKPESKDGFFWSFVPNRNKCSYYFISNKKASNGKRMAHRLTAIGYSSIPVED
jgi:hypothetical protein